jgi:glycosyltransferase involved in cell wall biosynthesis
MPLVSVIIPNFNHSKYLVQRIESILAQTFQDFELIILDDFSTDGSKNVIDRYANHEKVTHVVYNNENSGTPFLQWKKGIEMASGTYIWIAESDDWCEPTLLETLLQPFSQDAECVISYCQSYGINDQNEILFQSSHRRLSEFVEGRTFIKEFLSVPVAIFNASMVLWKKEKFQFISQDFTSFKFTGDWCFWIELSKHGNVHISAKVLNYFRKHDADVSGKAYKSGLNFIEELRIINNIFKEGLISEKAYYKAFKKKYVEYWMVRNTIATGNKAEIQVLFNQSLSKKASLTKLTPIAIWKKFQHDWLKRKK